MKILEIASEAVPYAKTGGLGDVLEALPEALAKNGQDVILILPYYRSVKQFDHFIIKTDISGKILIDNKNYSYQLYKKNHRKLSYTTYFVRCDELFDREELYLDLETSSDYKDNDVRFLFLNLAVLDAVKKLEWAPDIIHVHDWQAALIPALLKFRFQTDPFFENCKTILTIHNLAYQGVFPKETYAKLELPDELFYAGEPFEFYGKVNYLKAGIAYADKITTVSKTYADEIQTDEFGCGLDGVLKERASDLTGILNGVNYKIWSPSRDKKIGHNYHHANLSNKKRNKIEMLNECGLPHREKAPLIGIISRMTDQKGFDLIDEIADEIFSLNIQMVILGTGDKKYHTLFESLEQKYSDKCRAFLSFDEALAHRIEAAADIFLMPSKYEPCGLNQMYSLKYGTVPLVRKVGGLADSVVDLNDDTLIGTGFVFENYDSAELLKTIKRAATQFTRQREWIKIMKQGMKVDLSWDQSAEKYVLLFKELIDSKVILSTK